MYEVLQFILTVPALNIQSLPPTEHNPSSEFKQLC